MTPRNFHIKTRKLVLAMILGSSWGLGYSNVAAQADAEKTSSPPLAIKYTLKSAAKVSLNVYDASGQIVRELLHGSARKAGVQSEVWDGRDDAGKPLPPAKYSWKILGVPGFGAEYITNPGANYAVDPKGAWWAQSPGTHYGVNAIAVDESGVCRN